MPTVASTGVATTARSQEVHPPAQSGRSHHERPHRITAAHLDRTNDLPTIGPQGKTDRTSNEADADDHCSSLLGWAALGHDRAGYRSAVLARSEFCFCPSGAAAEATSSERTSARSRTRHSPGEDR